MTNIRLVPLEWDDREQFILDNQEAFNYGALEEFGMRDDHLGKAIGTDIGSNWEMILETVYSHRKKIPLLIKSEWECRYWNRSMKELTQQKNNGMMTSLQTICDR